MISFNSSFFVICFHLQTFVLFFLIIAYSQ
nr:MAG TPA: Protein of unknown function (DUF2650) [Caudoviricetes sp.]